MLTCYTCDLHGRLAQYDELTKLVRTERPELLILGGDMHVDGDPDDPLGTQVAFVERELVPRIDQWKALVPGLEVVCVLGNHDLACTQALLRTQHDAGRLVLLDHRRAWQHDGVGFLGMSCTPPTPHWVKDFERRDCTADPPPAEGGVIWDPHSGRLREVTAAEHFGQKPALDEVLRGSPAMLAPWIFVCHAPPYATKLDRLPNLDYPIGSRAVRTFIEQRQPLCALHGHVHESPQVTGDFKDMLGRTLCVNPGQSHDRLHAVVFDARRPAETLRHTVFD